MIHLTKIRFKQLHNSFVCAFSVAFLMSVENKLSSQKYENIIETDGRR